MHTIVTIDRQFGSGGKEVGIRVAKELGIPFYDEELIQEAAKKSGISEKLFESFDERPKSLLYSIAMDSYLFNLPGSIASDSLEQQVYLATFDTIRQLAEEGPCVIIGRCADYALANNPNLLSLFISAPMDVRIERVAKRQNISPEKARQLILKTDKRRAAYYEYYSSRKWGSVESYHYCLDSSYLGLGRTVELIQTMIAHKEHPIHSPTEFDPTRPEDQQ
jgi:cytidylate kinase